MDRTPEENALMIHQVHASARHWLLVGTVENFARSLSIAAGLLVVGLVATPLGTVLPAVHVPGAGPAPVTLLRPAAVTLTSDDVTTDFESWALMDTRTRKISGSANDTAINDTVSM